ncbi:hypothetical protein [Pseudomonas cerasi]|uniref:Uncharacterized protein n=1 Tax=Pseudomonas cerasi TaxID=1583341 RepID=A0A193SHJ5_9PSED|nr:hypothetical protein [Pseudomonas cerasi]CZT26408.1 hypothetical protein PCPL58_p5055 [Pseudomonas cerasi]SOS30357.1 hypothetical protein PL963_P300079 [Pseudomonas cerasi]
MLNSPGSIGISGPSLHHEPDRLEGVSANNLFPKLNPAALQKDSNVLSQLAALNNIEIDTKKIIVQELKDKLSNVCCLDKKYVENDIDLIKQILSDISTASKGSLNLVLKNHAVKAVKDAVYCFTFDDFSITHPNVNNESSNFNRILPSLGCAAQNYGYFGRKIILHTAEQMLSDYKKADRLGKFEKVILNDPSNEATELSTGDYYMKYLTDHGISLDEEYDKTKMS